MVHGDLSEYNILFSHREKRVWLIDFGQAVDRTHPGTETLLRRDLHTINRFFQRGDLSEATVDAFGLLSDEKVYDYVTSEKPDEVVADFPILAALLEEMTDVPAIETIKMHKEEEEEAEPEEAEQEETHVEEGTQGATSSGNEIAESQGLSESEHDAL